VVRGREEGGCGMGFVMLSEKKLRQLLFAEARRASQNFLPKEVSQQELLFQPHGHGGKKRLETTRSETDIGFEEPLEFDKRLVIEHNVFEILDSDTSFVQTILNGMTWKTWIMLLSRKALFLRRSDDLAILNKTGGAVMVVRRDTENMHAATSPLDDSRR
jgi:hypothetical protein